MLIIDCDTFFGAQANCAADTSAYVLVEALRSDGISHSIAYDLKARTYDVIEGNNRTLEVSRAYPEILPAASIDPRSFNRLEEEISRIAKLGFVVVRVFPESQGWSVDSVLFSRVVKACDENEIALMVNAESPGKASAIVERSCNTNIPIILVGANYNVLAEVFSAAIARPNTYVSTQYFVTPGIIEMGIGALGANRLVLGTGAPEFSCRPAINMVLGADISEEDKAKILGGNILSIIKKQLDRLGHTLKATDENEFIRRTITAPIIDVHGHLGPWPFPMRSWRTQELVQLMRKRGIVKAILSSTNSIVHDFVEGNAELAREIASYPELLGYVTINPNFPEKSIEEMERYLATKKFVGVKTHPGYSGQSIDGEAMRKLLPKIADKRVPFLIHCWGHEEPTKLQKIALEYPQIPFIMGHGGATAWREAIETMKAAPNVHTEFCSSRVERGRIRATIDAVGYERVLFGSDLGLFDPIYNLGIYEEADLNATECQAIMYENAKRVFGI
ncbi:MAG: amidohydrolase family protein [Armatimonadota bacterium]